MDYNKESIKLHRKNQGKLEIKGVVKLENKDDLSLAYTPGVGAVCLAIKEDENEYEKLCSSAKTVAVISDGSAVLGLGNIGPKAAMPVMEGKALLFKEFGGINAFPIVLDTQDTEEIIKTVKNIAPSFGGINLEDISAPRCFEIERRLKEELNIPVFHDDQHGTAIVVLAGLINALKITNRNKKAKIVINGAGAAGIAIAKLLHDYGMEEIIVCDSSGVISRHRENLEMSKLELLTYTNPHDVCCGLLDALKGADVFIGVSRANLLLEADIKLMAKDPIIMAMANPNPEIMPDLAKKAGAKIVATGRSDFPNQLNNVLVFPGIFKGAFEIKAKDITTEMKLAAAVALANLVEKPSEDKIIPGPFDKGVAEAISDSIKKKVKK